MKEKESDNKGNLLVVENITTEKDAEKDIFDTKDGNQNPFKYKYNIFHIEKNIYEIEPNIADVDATMFGKAVKTWLESNDINQHDICIHCDMPFEWIHDLEDGKLTPKPIPLFRLLYAMDITPKDIEKILSKYTSVKNLFSYWYNECSLEYLINTNHCSDMDRVKDVGMLVQVAMQTKPDCVLRGD